MPAVSNACCFNFAGLVTLELRLADGYGPLPLQLLDLAVEMRFRPGRLRDQEGITEEQVLAWWGKGCWEAAQNKAGSLLDESADLCERARSRAGDHDAIPRQLRERHPGFSDQAYGSAYEYGMFVSR